MKASNTRRAEAVAKPATRTPLPTLVRLNLLGYGLGGPMAAGLTFITDVYRPGAWKVLAPACLVLCLFALLIAVRRREGPLQAFIGLCYSCLLCGVLASYTVNDATAMGSMLVLSSLVFTGAARLSERGAYALMAVALVEFLWIAPVSNVSIVRTIFIDITVAGVCLVPSLTVMGFRRQLERRRGRAHTI